MYWFVSGPLSVWPKANVPVKVPGAWPFLSGQCCLEFTVMVPPQGQPLLRVGILVASAAWDPLPLPTLHSTVSPTLPFLFFLSVSPFGIFWVRRLVSQIPHQPFQSFLDCSPERSQIPAEGGQLLACWLLVTLCTTSCGHFPIPMLFTKSHLDLELFRCKRAKVLYICLKNFY